MTNVRKGLTQEDEDGEAVSPNLQVPKGAFFGLTIMVFIGRYPGSFRIIQNMTDSDFITVCKVTKIVTNSRSLDFFLSSGVNQIQVFPSVNKNGIIQISQVVKMRFYYVSQTRTVVK